MKTDVDTALKEIADFYIKNKREMTLSDFEAIVKKHCESEAEVKKFASFLETEPGQLRFKTLLRERKGSELSKEGDLGSKYGLWDSYIDYGAAVQEANRLRKVGWKARITEAETPQGKKFRVWVSPARPKIAGHLPYPEEEPKKPSYPEVKLIHTTVEGVAGQAFALEQQGYKGHGRYSSKEKAEEDATKLGGTDIVLVESKGAYDLYIKKPSYSKETEIIYRLVPGASGLDVVKLEKMLPRKRLYDVFSAIREQAGQTAQELQLFIGVDRPIDLETIREALAILEEKRLIEKIPEEEIREIREAIRHGSYVVFTNLDTGEKKQYYNVNPPDSLEVVSAALFIKPYLEERWGKNIKFEIKPAGEEV